MTPDEKSRLSAMRKAGRSYIATEDEESVKALTDKAEGKLLSEIDVPIPSREPEDLFYVNYSDLSVVYAELKQMVLDEMAEHGIDWYNDDDEDEE